jgi:hypothetical protein
MFGSDASTIPSSLEIIFKNQTYPANNSLIRTSFQLDDFESGAMASPFLVKLKN